MSKSRFSGAAMRLRLDGQIRAARAAAAGDALVLRAYERLLDVFRPRTSTLSNVALLAMAMHHAAWRAEPEAWLVADAEGERRALAALAQHLFARFAMPPCMANAWLDGELGERRAAHDWYIALGRGENIRRVGVPMPISRTMAHRFASAPAHLGVVAALRWAQLHVLDASPELTRAVLESSLGRELDAENDGEAYWPGALQFFVNHPEVAEGTIGPMIDYLRLHRLELRGRSPAALSKRVDEWHRTLENERRASLTWAPAPFRGLSWIQRIRIQGDEGDAAVEIRHWTIDEIRTSRALIEEGRIMRHCVASYTHRCLAGKCAIWSIRKDDKRILTVEINLGDRQIVQARRKCNAMPNGEEREVLARWAKREHLAIVESLR